MRTPGEDAALGLLLPLLALAGLFLLAAALHWAARELGLL